MYERLREVFTRIDVDGEIIFVNDASPDNAADVLRDLAERDRRVVVVNHSRNFGSQSAFTSGMRISTGDAVVLMDGDLQDPPELIEKLYRLYRATSYVRVPVDAGDFSLLDRRVVLALNALPENNRFLRGLRAWVGFKQVGVPYVRPERMFGSTTNSFLRNIQWARQAILSFSYVPLDLITWMGLLTVALAFIAIVAQIAVRLLYPQLVPSGFTTLIILILFLGGMQLIGLSIIGSYLAHIYDEVKRRPPYIVDTILNQPQPRLDD